MLIDWIHPDGQNRTASRTNPVPVEVNPAAGVVIPVGAAKLAIQAPVVTRPSDTTAYAAGDVVSNTGTAALRIFANAARANGGSGTIVKARLMTSRQTDTARFRLHLYHTAPAILADNAAFTLLWSQQASRVGYIDFPALTTEATGSDAAGALDGYVRLAYVCAAGDTALYGVLETLDAFTPASAQQFSIELTVERD